jgi:enterochelin esterase family protein
MRKELISPTIAKLISDFKSGNKAVLKDFWHKVEENGTPLIEPVENDENYKLVTFIVKADDDTRNVVIITALANQDDVVSNNVCERIESTNVFHKSFKVLNGTLTIYSISKNNSLRFTRFYENIMLNAKTLSPDPSNPNQFVQRYRREGRRFTINYSVLEMPNAKPRIWSVYNEANPAGQVEEIDFYSNILKMNRKIWVYTPPDFIKDREVYHFLVIFDGKAFLEFTKPQIIFDNLLAKNEIPKVVAVFIHNYNGFQRGKDLNCYPFFADFVARELVPWAQKEYYITSDPRQSVLIGSSSGGLGAAFIGYKYPEVFGKILAQSGFFGWTPGNIWFKRIQQFYGKYFERWWTDEDEKEDQWLIKQYLKSETLPLQFYINVGTLETRTKYQVASFLKMLQEKEYAYHFEEYPGGHEYIAWQAQLPDGLIYLIGSKK